MQLSPHFVLAEMTRSVASERLGIDNTPSDTEVANLRALCVSCLEPLRAHFARPVSVLSGFRSPRVNRHVGGVLTSRHVTGEAADIEVPGVSNLDLARWVASSGLPFDELILEFHEVGIAASGWVHLAARRHSNAGQVLTVTRRGMARGLP